MSPFDLSASIASARERLSARASGRRRSDAGSLRMDPKVRHKLHALLAGQERPSLAQVQREIASFCRRSGLRTPARATIYHALDRLDVHAYPVRELPSAIREALYNLDADSVVPGRQLAFSCLNYGRGPALSFAAGLPWVDLWQARQLRGWRPRSRGLLEAVLCARGIA